MTRTILLLAAVFSSCVAHGDALTINPPSTGFNGMVVYVSDGEFDPTTPHPSVPGCFSGICDGNYFWNEIAQADPAQINASEAAAKDFYLQRFGMDIDVLAGNGAISWLNTYTDPRVNYRARFVAGEHVHEFGWEVHEQVWLVVVNQELALGGEFEGHSVPPGSVLASGEYWIQKSRLIRLGAQPRIVNQDEYLRIKFQSQSPIVPPGINGRFSAVCDVTESPWGTGVGQIVSSFAIIEDDAEGGLARQNTRNVLTFDGATGLGTYLGVHND